jgi:hypothetical protein
MLSPVGACKTSSAGPMRVRELSLGGCIRRVTGYWLPPGMVTNALPCASVVAPNSAPRPSFAMSVAPCKGVSSPSIFPLLLVSTKACPEKNESASTPEWDGVDCTARGAQALVAKKTDSKRHKEDFIQDNLFRIVMKLMKIDPVSNVRRIPNIFLLSIPRKTQFFRTRTDILPQ